MDLTFGTPDPRLAGVAFNYADFTARSGTPEEMLEGPSRSVTVVVDLDAGWTVEGERFRSFVGGVYGGPVRVRHEGSFRGVQFELEPPAVRRLLGVPAGELARTTVGLDQLLGRDADQLAERLHAAPDAACRFAIVDELLLRRLRDAAPPRYPDVERAWTLLRSSGGTTRIEALADALGSSRRSLATRFAEDVGVGPKLAARLIRLEVVRARLGTAPLARLAAQHGFADQAHMTREFRALAGRPPTAFPEVQDPAETPG